MGDSLGAQPPVEPLCLSSEEFQVLIKSVVGFCDCAILV